MSPKFNIFKLLFAKITSYKVKNEFSIERLNEFAPLNQTLTPAFLEETMLSGKLFLRGVTNPNILSQHSKHHETNWEMELRKANRQYGFPTISKKSNRYTKDGNPNRSFTLAIPGINLFSSVGYGIISPNLTDISGVSSDMNRYMTGYGKKKHLKPAFRDNVVDLKADKAEQLLQLHQNAMNRSKEFFYPTINEVLITAKAKNISFIYLKYGGIEKALYMQNKYKKKFGIQIPIFKLSNEKPFFTQYTEKESNKESTETAPIKPFDPNKLLKKENDSKTADKNI